ncbi:MAG: 2-amino-4-hydroxy-6-hydroxymethyldihydropteridine diphosphokinase [Desulfobulbaceae bacterium]
MTTAYIGLGSNLGDPLDLVRKGWQALGEDPRVRLVRLSSPYRSEPVGMESDNWFINAAGEVETSLSPLELLGLLHAIEHRFGRERDPAAGYQDRTLDLDLLLYGNLVLREGGGQVPHPSLHERLFVLQPLAEIASGVMHPVSGRTIGELLASLLDRGGNPVVEKTGWRVGAPEEPPEE